MVSTKNIKKGKCLSCGHTWTPRNPKSERPQLCSKCGSHDCIWIEDTKTENPIITPAALMATVDGEPVTVEPIPKPTGSKEKEQPTAESIAAEVISQLKNDTEKDEEDRTEQNNKLVKSIAAEVINQMQDANKPTKKAVSIKKDAEVDSDDESDKKAVCEALRQIYGEDVQVIDRPIKKLAEEDDETPKFAVWQNEDGTISQGVIINPETFAEAERLLKENEAAERLNTTDIHLDRMNEGKLLDIDRVLDDADYEDDDIEACEGIEEEEEAKTEQNKGVPTIAVVIIWGIGIMALLPIILNSVKTSKKAEEAENKRETSANAPLISNYRGIPIMTGKLNGF